MCVREQGNEWRVLVCIHVCEREQGNEWRAARLAEKVGQTSVREAQRLSSPRATACGIRWRHPGGDVLQVVRRYDEGGQLLPLETTWP